jgi:hypothetical protein
MPWPITLALIVLANVASAISFGKAPVRALLSAALALTSFLLALTGEGPPLAGAMLAMASLLAPFRWLDLTRDRRDHPMGLRLWFYVTPFDVRRVVRVPPKVELGQVAIIVGFWSLFAVALAVVSHVGAPTSSLAWAMRWLAGAVVVYAMVDATSRLIVVGYRAGGFRIPTMHDDPILSRTLTEFWGERWNRAVHGLLDAHCFRPLARRRFARLGVVAAFVGSALLHAWLVFVALRDARMTLLMAVFFLAQGALMLLERALGVARWRPALGRAWTVGWMLVTTPLFVEPLLRVFGM